MLGSTSSDRETAFAQPCQASSTKTEPHKHRHVCVHKHVNADTHTSSVHVPRASAILPQRPGPSACFMLLCPLPLKHAALLTGCSHNACLLGPDRALGSREEVFTHDGRSREELKRNQSHLYWNKHLLCVQYHGNRAHKMHGQPSKGSWHITAISTCWKQADGAVMAQWGAQTGTLRRENFGQSQK